MRKLIGNSQYHAHEGIGSSFLKLIAEKSLFHALKAKHEQSEPMILGSALHCLVLTPEEFDDEFCLELEKANFANVVDTADEIKERITELTTIQLDNVSKELERLRKEKDSMSMRRNTSLGDLKIEFQKRLDNVDPDKFSSKRSYNTRLRSIKTDLRLQSSNTRSEYKARLEAVRTHIKLTQQKIATLKSYRTGKRDKLVANLKLLDPKAIIWGELLDTYRKDNANKMIISKALLERAHEMKRSVMEHSMARAMLAGGECEYAYFTDCPETGLPLKCKPDLKNQGLIDFKTTRDASDAGFMRECLRRKYHVQAAYYLDVHNLATGEDLKEFYFVAIENTFPYAVNVLELGEREIKLGRDEYKKAIKQYADYLTVKDHKPLSAFGYGQEIRRIVYPESAFQGVA